MPESPDFLEALYGDPLREETQKTGRMLVIASAVCMAVVIFQLRLTPTSWLPFDLAQHNDVLAMLLSWAVLLLFLSFAFRAATDLFQDHETVLLIERYLADERIKASEAAARAVDEQVGRYDDEQGYEPEPWWEAHHEVTEAAEAAVKRAEDRIGTRRAPQWVRRVRKWLEIAVPSLFAIVALVISRESLANFAVSLWIRFSS